MHQIQTWLQHSLFTSLLLLASTPICAQITPDNTLGAESSRVTPSDRIEGGATRGTNLFHSFSQFNVNNGQQVYFVNPVGIENILTRVTGTEASRIMGTLGVEGNANLFLLNPNGILFGPNARLDLKGSFVGTTANAIGFGEQGMFSATNPQAPPLLTINPSALLFRQLNAANITNQSLAPAGVSPTGNSVTGLRVPDGESLLLVGGNINIEGGKLRAYGGNIELASFAAPTDVGLNVVANHLSLVIPEAVERADITFSNGAEANVRGADGGSIKISGRNVTLTKGSFVRAGIDTGLGTANSQGGHVEINATGTTTLSDGSFIANVLNSGAIGHAGDIIITTDSLEVTNSSLNTWAEGQGHAGDIIITTDSLKVTNSSFNTATYGQGDAGNVIILADDTALFDAGDIFTSVQSDVIGNGGQIQISTGTLSLLNGGQFVTSSQGQGNGGDVVINARDRVSIDGQPSSDGFSSAIFSKLTQTGIGRSGNIQINTGSLHLTNGAQLSAATSGQGNSGHINIQATDTVELRGQRSTIFNNVASGAVGNSGHISITANSLSLIDGGQLRNGVDGTEIPGGIGRGNGGNITLNIRGALILDQLGSLIESDVGVDAQGNAGQIIIHAGTLAMSNKSSITNSSNGRGNAGDLSIQVEGAMNLDNGFIFSIFAPQLPETVGKGGNIHIQAGSLSLANQSSISTQSAGQGNGGDLLVTTDSLLINNSSILTSLRANAQGKAGNIQIDARDFVSVQGQDANIQSVLFDGVGRGGDITINTRELSVTNAVGIASITDGQGDAGHITLNASDLIFVDNSKIFTFVGTDGQGNGGNIDINTGVLSFHNGAQLLSSTFGVGDAGKISIVARDSVSFSGANSDGLGSGAYSTVQTGVEGRGGDIEITTGSLSLKGGAQLNTSTFGQGHAGDIIIDANRNVLISGTTSTNSGVFAFSGATGAAGDIFLASPRLILTDNGFISAASNAVDGGNITLNLEQLLMRRSSEISATTGFAQGAGDGGNITINATTILAVAKENSDITANAFSGKGGNVTINTQGLFGIAPTALATEQSDITATSQIGFAGEVNIIQPETQPTQGILELPAQVLDASNQIAQSCPKGVAARSLAEFVISGRGSLPPSPMAPLAGAPSLSPLASLDGVNTDEVKVIKQDSTTSVAHVKTTPEIVEAQGWMRTADGKVMLVAQVPEVTPSPISAMCPISQHTEQ